MSTIKRSSLSALHIAVMAAVMNTAHAGSDLGSLETSADAGNGAGTSEQSAASKDADKGDAGDDGTSNAGKGDNGSSGGDSGAAGSPGELVWEGKGPEGGRITIHEEQTGVGTMLIRKHVKPDGSVKFTSSTDRTLDEMKDPSSGASDDEDERMTDEFALDRDAISDPTAEDINRLESRIALLKRRLEVRELEAQIAEAKRDSEEDDDEDEGDATAMSPENLPPGMQQMLAQGGAPGGAAPGGGQSQDSDSEESDEEEPQVLSFSSTSDGDLMAKLVFSSDGSTQWVRKGERVGEWGTVERIDQRGVVLTDGKAAEDDDGRLRMSAAVTGTSGLGDQDDEDEDE